jgi:hypothetical protein
MILRQGFGIATDNRGVHPKWNECAHLGWHSVPNMLTGLPNRFVALLRTRLEVRWGSHHELWIMKASGVQIS